MQLIVRLGIVGVLVAPLGACGGRSLVNDAGGGAGKGTAGSSGGAGAGDASADEGPAGDSAVPPAYDGPLLGALPDFADGTRLQARFYETAGGAKLFRDWWDSMRQEVCTFQLAPDGKTRCLPPHVESAYFVDGACKVRSASAPACAGPPAAYLTARAATPTMESCAPGAFYKVNGKVATPAALFYDEDGPCLSTENTPGDDPWETWTASEIVPPTAFVEAELILDGRGPTLDARYLRGADGSLQLAGAYDRAAARACAYVPHVAGRCLPDAIHHSFLYDEFADPQCKQKTVVLYPANACEREKPAGDFVLVEYGECNAGNKIYAVGPAYTERPFLPSGGSTCAQSMSNKVGVATPYRHLLGDVTPGSAFPAVKLTDEGDGRVKVRTVTTPDGDHLLTTNLVDSQLGQTCTPADVGGTLRCLPDASMFPDFIFYADPACKQPVYYSQSESQSTGCAQPKQVTLRDRPGCSTPGAPHLYEVGAALATQVAYGAYNGDPCYKFDPPLYGTVYAMKELPLTDAPAVTAHAP